MLPSCSLAETWGFHLSYAARGYHSGLPDRRWVVDDRWRAVGDALFAEVAAGRIAYDTHVVYVTPGVNSVEAALYTGISMDPFTPQWSADNIWLVGTRVKSMQELPAALAAKPALRPRRRLQRRRERARPEGIRRDGRASGDATLSPGVTSCRRPSEPTSTACLVPDSEDGTRQLTCRRRRLDRRLDRLQPRRHPIRTEERHEARVLLALDRAAELADPAPQETPARTTSPHARGDSARSARSTSSVGL